MTSSYTMLIVIKNILENTNHPLDSDHSFWLKAIRMIFFPNVKIKWTIQDMLSTNSLRIFFMSALTCPLLYLAWTLNVFGSCKLYMECRYVQKQLVLIVLWRKSQSIHKHLYYTNVGNALLSWFVVHSICCPAYFYFLLIKVKTVIRTMDWSIYQLSTVVDDYD